MPEEIPALKDGDNGLMFLNPLALASEQELVDELTGRFASCLVLILEKCGPAERIRSHFSGGGHTCVGMAAQFTHDFHHKPQPGRWTMQE